jgi:hypothetical protein
VSGEKLHQLLQQVYATPKDILDMMATLSDRN